MIVYKEFMVLLFLVINYRNVNDFNSNNRRFENRMGNNNYMSVPRGSSVGYNRDYGFNRSNINLNNQF